MHLPPVALQNIFFAIQQKYKAPQIESSTCNCSTKGWLGQLWIAVVGDILTWAVADLYCCFLLLQIVIGVVLYFVQKLALAVVDCYAETEFLGHGVASLNAFGNFFLQLLHTKNTKNLLFHQGLFAPAFELLIASGALILDQIGKSAF